MSHPLDKRKEDVLPLFHRCKDRYVGLRGLWTGKTPVPTGVKVLHEPAPAVKIPQMSLSGCLRFLSATVPQCQSQHQGDHRQHDAYEHRELEPVQERGGLQVGHRAPAPPGPQVEEPGEQGGPEGAAEVHDERQYRRGARALGIRDILDHPAAERSAIDVDDTILDAVVTVTTHFGIDGHRADITMMKAAKANAALDLRSEVTKDDIRDVASLVLSHRMRRRPFEEAAFDTQELEECLKTI